MRKNHGICSGPLRYNFAAWIICLDHQPHTWYSCEWFVHRSLWVRTSGSWSYGSDHHTSELTSHRSMSICRDTSRKDSTSSRQVLFLDVTLTSVFSGDHSPIRKEKVGKRFGFRWRLEYHVILLAVQVMSLLRPFSTCDMYDHAKLSLAILFSGIQSKDLKEFISHHSRITLSGSGTMV